LTGDFFAKLRCLSRNRESADRTRSGAPTEGTISGSSFSSRQRVVSTEGLIGLKLQGFVNNPRRTQDLEDIKAPIAANRQALKMGGVREYFRFFNRKVLPRKFYSERTYR
jgi:hypothetical protein